MSATPRIVYCHCQYAQVVPKEAKEVVLQQLCQSGRPFEAVADLCELSARKDPLLHEIAQEGRVKIIACYPRAVKWLFSAAGAALDPATVQVCNLRVDSAQTVIQAIESERFEPNLPDGKTVVPAASSPPNSTP